MKLLIDTHTFLWFIDDSPRLSARAKQSIEAADEVYLSVASLWEIAVKISLEKLTLRLPFEDLATTQLTSNAIRLLSIAVEHLAGVATLPFHHRDPFDRLLIAQALAEELSVVSVDPLFDAYAVKRLW